MSESVFKVLVIGEPAVGKTSMVARYCYRDWIPNYKATVGADYAVKSMKVSPTESVRLHIWDIAGQDHYRAMTRTYYRGAAGCIILFDVTNRKSFIEAKTWKNDLDEKVALSNGENVPCLLIANKDDLPDKRVTQNEIAKFAKDNGFFHWSSVSVKDNRNISESISQLVQKMLEQEKETALLEPQDQDNRLINLHKPESEQKQHSNGCCGGSG